MSVLNLEYEHQESSPENGMISPLFADFCKKWHWKWFGWRKQKWRVQEDMSTRIWGKVPGLLVMSQRTGMKSWEFCMKWFRWRHITAFLPRRLCEFLLSRPCLQEPLQCSWTKESLWSHRHGLTFIISSALQRSLTIQAISPWLSQFRVTARIHFRNANHFPRSKSRCGASDLCSEIQLSSSLGVHNQTGWCYPAMIDGNLESALKNK